MRRDTLDFASDNFKSRRTTGHNLYDPNATITEGELRRGLTYENSFAVYHGGDPDSPSSYHREFVRSLPKRTITLTLTVTRDHSNARIRLPLHRRSRRFEGKGVAPDVWEATYRGRIFRDTSPMHLARSLFWRVAQDCAFLRSPSYHALSATQRCDPNDQPYDRFADLIDE